MRAVLAGTLPWRRILAVIAAIIRWIPGAAMPSVAAAPPCRGALSRRSGFTPPATASLRAACPASPTYGVTPD
jgi:hypothetical protein